MFGRSKNLKKGLMAVVLYRILSKNLGRILIIGGLTGGLIKLAQGMKAKKQEITPGKVYASGAYGAVAIAKAFKDVDFPLSKQDIMERFGDREIEYHLGRKERLGDILQDIPDQVFNRTTELEHALHETIRERHNQ